MTADQTTVPHGRTAQRLTWPHLPPELRRLIEQRCGAAVVDARSQSGGFTPGFASVLTTDDGRQHFVKAASVKAQRPFAESYREEARKLRGLPDGVPAARLLWLDEGDWVVLGLEYVEGRAPRRPWRTDELDRCLDTLEQAADLLTPAPAALSLDPIATELGAWPGHWDDVRRSRPALAHLDRHLDEAATLAAGFAAVTTGETLVHTDVRDDNLLIGDDGVVTICDWNWPVTGAAWLDTVFLLLGPRGDGVDVDAILARRPLTCDVPADHVDTVIALLAGYFAKAATDPVPPTSPYLRLHQAWCRDAAWAWLSERRGWSGPPG